MNDNVIHYRYFRRWYLEHTSKIVSIGYEILPTLNPTIVNIVYAITFCGGKDIFSRKKAREVIKDRLNIGLVVNILAVNTLAFPEKNFPELIRLHYNTHNKKFVPEFIGVKQIPAWARHIDV